MNVLLVSESLWPYGGGGELATYLYARLLVSEGIRIKVLLRSRNGSEEWRGLEVYSISSIGAGKYSIIPRESAKLVEGLTRWADVVYFTGLFELIPLVRRIGKPFVVHIHSYFPLCPVGHMYNFIYGKVCTSAERTCYKCVWIYESMRRGRREALASTLLNGLLGTRFLRYVLHADAIIFVSKYQQKLFIDSIRFMHVEVPKNFVVYNPIPNLEYEPLEGDDISFLGGLDPIKGFYVLFRAWLKTYKRFQGAKLRAAMTSDLPSSVEKVNIIRYPRLDSGRLRYVFRKSRGVVVPSVAPEPSPYAAIEALLRGRILIASNVGGVYELVGHAPGAKLVPPNNVEALTDALDWALSMDRRDVIELGFKNREYAFKKFNSERSVRELIDIFNNVMRRY
jgi:glycosyltransferase involved in cell wall biosynthesis